MSGELLLPGPVPAERPEAATTPRERKRRETRERVFASAIAEFREAGFANAQIDRIVEAARVSRGTFYFHFPTKEHVLLELQRRGQFEVVDRLRSAGQYPRSVRKFLRFIYETILSSLHVDAGLRRELLAMYVRQPIRVEMVNEPLVLEVVDYLADAAERGAVRTDIAPEQLAIHFLSSLFPLLGTHNDDPTSAPSQDAFDLWIELFLNGAATESD